MKFKGLTSMVLAGVATMSMSVPAFATNVCEQTVNHTQETVCVTTAESADNLTAINKYATQEGTSSNSKIDILGDENGGPVTRGSNAPTDLWNWGDKIYYGACLPLYSGRGVYTNYKFKPTDRKLIVNMNLYAEEDWSDKRTITVMLYKKSGATWSNVSLRTCRFVPDPTEPLKTFNFPLTFTGLDNNAEYCVRLYNDSTVKSGYTVSDYATGADFTVSPTETLRGFQNQT